MTNPLDPEVLRARFADLTAQAEAIHAVRDPLRENRDAVVNANREAEALLDEEIKTAETGLFEIDQERANISRFLNGKTGSPSA